MTLQIVTENGDSFITEFAGSFDDAINHYSNNPLYPDSTGVKRKITFIIEQKKQTKLAAKVKTPSYLIAEQGEFREGKGNLFIVSRQGFEDRFHFFIHVIGESPYFVAEFTTGIPTCGSPDKNKKEILITAIKRLSAIHWHLVIDTVEKRDKQNTLPENLSDFSRVHIYGY